MILGIWCYRLKIGAIVECVKVDVPECFRQRLAFERGAVDKGKSADLAGIACVGNFLQVRHIGKGVLTDVRDAVENETVRLLAVGTPGHACGAEKVGHGLTADNSRLQRQRTLLVHPVYRRAGKSVLGAKAGILTVNDGQTAIIRADRDGAARQGRQGGDGASFKGVRLNFGQKRAKGQIVQSRRSHKCARADGGSFGCKINGGQRAQVAKGIVADFLDAAHSDRGNIRSHSLPGRTADNHIGNALNTQR